MHAASMIATGFSVVTTLGRTRIIAEHLVRNYGMEHHCRRVRATELPVLELENPASDARRIITEECRRAISGGWLRGDHPRLRRNGGPYRAHRA